MLYRNPDTATSVPRPGLFASLIQTIRAARRRRMAHLDVLALSRHMRRDLGLIDAPFHLRRL